MSTTETLDKLIDATNEEAVFTMLTVISAFDISSREHARIIIDQDPDCREWLFSTFRMIPTPPKSSS